MKRLFFALSALIILSMLLSACGASSSSPAQEDAAAQTAVKTAEAALAAANEAVTAAQKNAATMDAELQKAQAAVQEKHMLALQADAFAFRAHLDLTASDCAYLGNLDQAWLATCLKAWTLKNGVKSATLEADINSLSGITFGGYDSVKHTWDFGNLDKGIAVFKGQIPKK